MWMDLAIPDPSTLYFGVIHRVIHIIHRKYKIL